MKLKIYISHLLPGMLLLTAPSVGVGAPAWVQRFTGSAGAGGNAFAIGVDESGSVFVAGSWSTNFTTVKYSHTGVPLWTNYYHGPGTGSDVARALAVDASGNVLVAGSSANTEASPYNYDFVTIKYSGTGVPLWTNCYHPPFDASRATALALHTNGDVMVTGYSTGSGVPTIKYSSGGTPMWTNLFHYPGDSASASDIAVDSAGNVFITGHANGPGGGDDILTIKYLNSGVPAWTNRYNGPGNADDYANEMAMDQNGNVFITGGSVVGGQIEFVTIKYLNSGVPAWTNRYKGPGNSTYGGAGDIAVDSSGNVIVTGASVGSGTYNDFATLKYSNAGVPLWTNRYNRIYDDVSIDLATDRADNVFVCGYSTDPNTLRFDNTIVAYSSTGQLLWTNIYNGPGNDDDSGNAIAVDRDGNVFVTGYSRGANSYNDYATIKMWGRQPIPLNIQPEANALVLNWSNPTFLLQSAPTAAGPFTNILGATSPRTNSLGSPQQYFRLKLN
jgi:hypothetical protein